MMSRVPRIFTQVFLALLAMNLTWACACALTGSRLSTPSLYKRLNQAVIADSQAPSALERTSDFGSPGPAALSLVLLHLSTLQPQPLVDFAAQITPVSALVRAPSRGRAPPFSA
jgi:hypothetical protein